MLTVEDCLKRLEVIEDQPLVDRQGNPLDITNTWDARFISDVASHVANKSAISTAQSRVLLKLIDRYRDHLEAGGLSMSQVDQLLQFPQYDRPLYESTVLPREVRWAGDNKLVFRCKYNAAIIQDIKRLKTASLFSSIQYPFYMRDHKLWIVDVNAHNVKMVMDVIKRHKFEFDDAVAQFFLDIENHAGVTSQAKVSEQEILVTINDDSFLSAWINALLVLER